MRAIAVAATLVGVVRRHRFERFGRRQVGGRVLPILRRLDLGGGRNARRHRTVFGRAVRRERARQLVIENLNVVEAERHKERAGLGARRKARLQQRLRERWPDVRMSEDAVGMQSMILDVKIEYSG